MGDIDTRRSEGNLSSAIRLFVFDHYRTQTSGAYQNGRWRKYFDGKRNMSVVADREPGSPLSPRRRPMKMSLDIPLKQFAEEKFRLAVESSSSGVVMTDRSGMIVMVNSEIERVFGYRRRELIRQPIEMLVPLPSRGPHASDRSGFSEIRRIGLGCNLQGLRKDGTKFPVEVGLNPIRVGDELFVLSAIVDISERKRGEEMFRLAVEACPSGMVMADGAGTIVMTNTEVERLFGYSSGGVGRPVGSGSGPGAVCATGTRPIPGNCPCVRSSGARIPVPICLGCAKMARSFRSRSVSIQPTSVPNCCA